MLVLIKLLKVIVVFLKQLAKQRKRNLQLIKLEFSGLLTIGYLILAYHVLKVAQRRMEQTLEYTVASNASKVIAPHILKLTGEQQTRGNLGSLVSRTYLLVDVLAGIVGSENVYGFAVLLDYAVYQRVSKTMSVNCGNRLYSRILCIKQRTLVQRAQLLDDGYFIIVRILYRLGCIYMGQRIIVHGKKIVHRHIGNAYPARKGLLFFIKYLLFAVGDVRTRLNEHWKYAVTTILILDYSLAALAKIKATVHCIEQLTVRIEAKCTQERANQEFTTTMLAVEVYPDVAVVVILHLKP